MCIYIYLHTHTHTHTRTHTHTHTHTKVDALKSLWDKLETCQFKVPKL